MVSTRQRVGAFALLALLALQMALPVAHASAHAGFSARAAGATQTLQPAAARQDASDPAACPVCQSLHARAAALPPAPLAAALSVSAGVAVAPPLEIPAHVARTAYSPRAPPLEAHPLA
jgi:hypothetical protein